MIIQALAFYLFAALLIAAAVMVVAARNPVHSVLFLILAFFNAAGLFVLIGAEFIAMILVLFLFVVMMLDINFVELRAGFLQYLPIGSLIGLILLVELVLVVATWAIGPDAATLAAPQAKLGTLSNTEQIGTLLYTRYIYLFQAAGMVLLIAMIGAIVLTLRSREGVRRQKIARQVSRRVEDTVELKKVPTRSGV